MTDVENKVVEMRFDSSQFEKGVQSSINATNRLKESLDFSGTAKSMDELSKVASGVDLSGLQTSLDAIKDRFSAAGIMGITVLTRITNAAIDAGIKINNALTITPMKTGFQEYELKMGSVQTIMAATGESIDKVNQYLEELNKYSDQTIYSFSDMTSNIGKFTNAGVKLEDAVAAIKGISNEAAVSGANAQQASHAMYNFSQALSSGFVKLIDWKSIENANMATKEFKEQLIQTGVEIGVLKKSANGMYDVINPKGKGGESTFNALRYFNDSLATQWMTTDVLTKTLAKYADSTTDIGKKAFAAAQDIKTFSMMVDTLKEAMQSGWAQTWERLFGNLEEAKKLWTAIGNSLGGIIETVDNFRNGILDAANQYIDVSRYAPGAANDAFVKGQEQMLKVMGKTMAFRNNLMESFQNLYNFMAHIANAIGGAFFDVFFAIESGTDLSPFIRKLKTLTDTGMSLAEATAEVKKELAQSYFGKMLAEFSVKIRQITESILKNEDVLRSFYFIASGVFSLLKIGLRLVQGLLTVVGSLLKAISPALLAMLKFAGFIGFLVTKLADLIDESGAITNLFNFLGKAIVSIGKFLAVIVRSLGRLKLVQKTLVLIASAAVSIFNAISKFKMPTFDAIIVAFDKFTESLNSLFAEGGFSVFISKWLDINIDRIGIREVVDKIKEKIRTSISNMLLGLKNGASQMVSSIYSLFADVIIPKVWSGVAGLFFQIDDFLGQFHWERLLNIAKIAAVATSITIMSASFITLSSAISDFKLAGLALVVSIKETIDSLNGYIKAKSFDQVIDSLQKMTGIILALGAMSIIIASLPEETYRNAVATLKGLIVTITACIVAAMTMYYMMLTMKTISTTRAVTDWADAFTVVGKSFATGFTTAAKQWVKAQVVSEIVLSIALSIGVMAAAMKMLNDSFAEMDPDKFNGFGAVITMLGFLLIGVGALSFISKKVDSVGLTTMSIMMDSLALSILGFAGAIKLLASEGAADIKAASGAIGGLVVALGIFVGILGSLEGNVPGFRDNLTDVTIAIIGLSVAMTILAGALKMLTDVNPDQLTMATLSLGASMLVLTAAVAALVGIMVIANKDFLDLDKTFLSTFGDAARLVGFAVMILAVAASIKILSSAILSFQNVTDVSKILLGLGVLTLITSGFIASMAAMGLVLKGFKIPENLFKLAAAILSFTFAIRVFSSMPVDMMIQGLSAVSGALVALSIATRIANGAHAAEGITKFGLAIGALAVSIGIMSLFDWQKVLTSAMGLSAVIIAFGVAAQLSSVTKVAPLIAFFAGLGLLLLEIRLITYEMKPRDLAMIAGYLASVAGLVLSTGVVIALSKNVSKGASDLYGMAAVFTALSLVVAAVGYAANAISSTPGGVKSAFVVTAFAAGLIGFVAIISKLLSKTSGFNLRQFNMLEAIAAIIASVGLLMMSIGVAAKLVDGKVDVVYQLIPAIMGLSLMVVGLAKLVSVAKTSPIDSVKGTLQSMGVVFGSIAALIATIAAAAWLTQEQGLQEEMMFLTKVISLIGLTMAALVTSIGSIQKLNEKQIAALGVTFFAMLAMLTGVIVGAKLINGNRDLERNLLEIGALVVILTFTAKSVLKSLYSVPEIDKSDLFNRAAAMIIVPMAMATIVSAFAVLSSWYTGDINNIVKLVASTIVLMGAAETALYALKRVPIDGRNTKTMRNKLIMLGVLLTEMAAATAAFAAISTYGDPLKTLEFVGTGTAFFAALTGILWAIKELKIDAKGIGKMKNLLVGVAVLAAEIGVVMFAFTKISNEVSDIKALIGVCVTAAGFFVALGGLVKVLDIVGKEITTNIGNVYTAMFTAGLLAIEMYGVMLAFSELASHMNDMSGLITTCTTAALFFAALGGLVYELGAVGLAIVGTEGVGAAALAAGMASVAILAGEMWLAMYAFSKLQDIDISGITQILIVSTLFFTTLGLLMPVLGVAGLFMPPALLALDGIAIMAAEMYFVMKAFDGLASTVNINALATFLSTTTKTFIAMTAIFAVLGVFGILTPSAIIGAVGLIEVLAILIGGLAFMSRFEASIDAAFGVIKKLSDLVMNLITNAASNLPELGEDLGKFGINAKPFFAMLSTLPATVLSNVKAFAETVGILAGITWGSLLAFPATGMGTITLSAELILFAENLKVFSKKCEEIQDWDTLVKATTAISNIATAAKDIPNMGGLLALYVGDNGLGAFGKELSEFIPYMQQMYTACKGMSIDANGEPIASAVRAMDEIFIAAHDIPNSGPSVIGFFTGDNDLGEFGRQLTEFARNFVGPDGNGGFYAMVKNVGDWSVITNAVTAMGNIMQAVKDMPRTGSHFSIHNWMVGFDIGEKDLAAFGENLKSFAESLQDLSSLNINVSGIQNFIDAWNIIKEIKFHGLFSDLRLRAGYSLNGIEEKVRKIGEIVKTFQDSVSKINVDQVAKTVDTFSKLFSLKIDVTVSKSNANDAGKEVVMAFFRGLGMTTMTQPSRLTQLANFYFWEGWKHKNAERAKEAADQAAKDGKAIMDSFMHEGLDEHSNSKMTDQANAFFWGGYKQNNATRAEDAKDEASQNGKDIIDEFMKSATDFNSSDLDDAANLGEVLAEIEYEGYSKKLGELTSTGSNPLVDAITSRGSIPDTADARSRRSEAFHEGKNASTYKYNSQADMYYNQYLENQKKRSAAEVAYAQQQEKALEAQRNNSLKNEQKYGKAKLTYAQQQEKALEAQRKNSSKNEAKWNAANNAAADKKTIFDHMKDLADQVKTATGLGDFKAVQDLEKQFSGWLDEYRDKYKETGLIKDLTDLATKGFDTSGIQEEISKLTNPDGLLDGLAEEAEKTSEKLDDPIKKVQDLMKEYSDGLSNARNDLMNATSLFSEVDWGFDPENPVTKEKLKKNLEDQITQLDRFGNVLVSLNSRITNEGLKEAIEQMGPAQLEELEALNSMTDDELAHYEKLYAGKVEKANQFAREKMIVEGDRIAAEIGAQLDWGGRMVDMDNLYNILGAEPTEEQIKEMQQIGKYISEGIADGMTDDEALQYVAQANATLRDMGVEAARAAWGIHSPSEVMKDEVGIYVRQGLVDPLINDEAQADYRVTAMLCCSLLIQAFEEQLWRFNEFGYKISDQIAQGIQNGSSSISSTINSILSSAGIDVAVNNMSKMANGAASGVNAKQSGATPVYGPQIPSNFNTNVSTNLAGNANSMTAAAKSAAAQTYNDSRIVQSIDKLDRDITDLWSQFNNLQVVMDGRALVGQIVAPMNQALGTYARQEARTGGM